ncbi:ASCH domain-containing protein [Cerasibacillus terrae]|uniref:ASCH domain-containing protein n=1 Tax=Cerasibacillus terrae TaxID=2498845 RepID=A0A5C8NKP6_9BACI|nr:ASCH domain-containing protein [Cerasibacillus terrae]TXL61720.1 ASCH domain-containing protein [Cerasibacillus terrae]
MRHEKNFESLPEKTCTIEKLVTIPEDVEKVINGQKTATRRNGIYADIGEVMTLKGKNFKVDAIYPQYLGDVTEEDAKKEGYNNLEEYKQAILGIHPGMRWVPKMRVWVHEYSPVNA